MKSLLTLTCVVQLVQDLHLQVPARFWGLLGWLSGEVRLCLRPTSSDGDVGREETGGVWARRVGTRLVVG